MDNKDPWLKALHYAELCEQVYCDNEPSLQQNNSDYKQVEYHSYTSHKSVLKSKWLGFLFTYLRGQLSLVDIQFVVLSNVSADNTKTITAVIKGSEEIEDWATNVQFTKRKFYNKGYVHKGFYESAKIFLRLLAQEPILQRVKKIVLNKKLGLIKRFIAEHKVDTKIVLAGHSLGGAIATLVGVYLIEKGIKPENIEVYSFGAPPIGSIEFCEQFHAQLDLYRFINQGDYIPDSDAIVDFKHVGQPILLESDKYQSHSIHDYIANISNRVNDFDAL